MYFVSWCVLQLKRLVAHRNFTYFHKNWYFLWSYDILTRLDRSSLKFKHIDLFRPCIAHLYFNVFSDVFRCFWCLLGVGYKYRYLLISERTSSIGCKYHTCKEYINFFEKKWNSCAPHAFLAATCTKRQSPYMNTLKTLKLLTGMTSHFNDFAL